MNKKTWNLPQVEKRDLFAGAIALFLLIAIPVALYQGNVAKTPGDVHDALKGTEKDAYCLELEAAILANSTSGVICECFPAGHIPEEHIPVDQRVRDLADLKAVLVCERSEHEQPIVVPLWESN